jgi:hypothetical protein
MAEVYKLSDAHRPSLLPGPYELEVSWKVKIKGESSNGEGTESVKFHVASERFWLNPPEIDSVYPPEGSSGDYSNDLPHVALSRDTLPWERTAKAGSDRPWLALLLFNQEEAAKCPLTTITLKDYKDRLAAYSPQVLVDLEQDQEKNSVTVIELPRDFPNDVLPKLPDLSVLCHARVTEDAGKPANSVAVVVSKRLPAPGRNTAHLVMLENRFTGDNFPLAGNTTGCLLISLKSWSFTSQPTTAGPPDLKSADAGFSQLKPGWLKFDPCEEDTGIPPGFFPLIPTKRTPTDYERAGYVPLPHCFRSGESGASWYAGPLTCGVPIFKNEDAAQLVKLPARSADSLLWFDEALGMLNVRYAAAWELGRLLAMQNRSMFSLLHKWRSQQVHCHQASSEAETGAACCHVPQVQCAGSKSAPQAPPELKKWLNSLRCLQGIPYRYLLPDERLLPPDSVRFVFLDPYYVDSLLDGVLSSVRAASPCPDRCRQGEVELLAGVHPPVVTGFFLRSVRVAGLPRLEAKAICRGLPDTLEVYSSARLSPSILLYLFKGRADRITLRQKPDTVHLSTKGKSVVTSSQRALTITAATGAAFAKDMMPDQLEELTVDVPW